MKIHSLILAALVLVGGTATLTAQVDSTILRDRQIKAMTELLQLTPEQIEKLTQLHAASQGGQGNNLQERLVKLSEQLGLKPEQKTKFIAIAQEHDEKTRAIHQDQNTSREDKDAKVNALNEASKTKLQELLTAEQFEKLIQLHSQPEKKN